MRYLLIILVLLVSCGGGSNNPTFHEPDEYDVWNDLMDCLADTEWGNDYIKPETILVEAPCGGEHYLGCLAGVYYGELRCLGIVELDQDYAYTEEWRDGTMIHESLFVHEYLHSVHAQRYCGEPNHADNRHESELFNSEFVCSPGKFKGEVDG